MMAASRFRWNAGIVVAIGFPFAVVAAESDSSSSDAKTRVVPCARKKAQRASVARVIAAESRFSRGVATKGY
jgi:hypothetical protein